MPKMPVVAKMPDGTLRLVWADPDSMIAFKASGEATAYIVDIKTEEEFARLQRIISEVEGGDVRGN